MSPSLCMNVSEPGSILRSCKSVLNTLIVQIVEGWITQWRWKVYNLKQFPELGAIRGRGQHHYHA